MIIETKLNNKDTAFYLEKDATYGRCPHCKQKQHTGSKWIVGSGRIYRVETSNDINGKRVYYSFPDAIGVPNEDVFVWEQDANGEAKRRNDEEENRRNSE